MKKYFLSVLILFSSTGIFVQGKINEGVIDEKSQTSFENNPFRLGLCLSGGAARGFAHVGVLRAFDEASIEVDCLSGSSMGALIALLHATGKTPDEIMEMAQTIKTKKLKAIGSFHFGKAGLDYVEQLLNEIVEETTFEQLNIPLYICATNFQTGKYEIIDTGDIMPAIRASVAVPIKYGYQFINGVPYVDGGVVNNLPVEPLRERSQIVIGVSVNPIVIGYDTNLRSSIQRLTELMVNENEKFRIAMCDYHFEIPGLGEIGLEDYDRAYEIHDLGYQAAKEFIKNNPELISNLN